MRLLRLWPDESHFDFMRFRRFTFPLSAIVSVATVVLFLTMGLNYGIDFKGGTLVELQAKAGQKADVARSARPPTASASARPRCRNSAARGRCWCASPSRPASRARPR